MAKIFIPPVKKQAVKLPLGFGVELHYGGAGGKQNHPDGSPQSVHGGGAGNVSAFNISNIGENYKKNKLSSVSDVMSIVSDYVLPDGMNLYIRWSRGAKMDKEIGRSLDQVSGQRHNGLSAQNLRVDQPELMAAMIPEYQFLKRKDPKIHAWIFAGIRNGTDSDDAPTVEADSIVPIGVFNDAAIEKFSNYSRAYMNKRTKYLYNPNKPEHFERNKNIDDELSKAWDEIK